MASVCLTPGLKIRSKGMGGGLARGGGGGPIGIPYKAKEVSIVVAKKRKTVAKKKVRLAKKK